MLRIDIEWLRKTLRPAAHAKFQPAEIMERQVVETLMPQLIRIRQDGFSIDQISRVLADLGVDFRASTLRLLYQEQLHSMIDRQLQLLSESAQPQVYKAQEASTNNNQGQDAPTTKKSAETQPEGEFGLLNDKDAAQRSDGQFFDFVTTPAQSTPGPTPGRCLQLMVGIDQLPMREGIPEAVYQEGLLEHPAIPGLMLNRAERLYGAYLEYSDAHGEMKMESPKEKPFRIKWKKPIPPTISSTDGDFVNLNPALFPKG